MKPGYLVKLVNVLKIKDGVLNGLVTLVQDTLGIRYEHIGSVTCCILPVLLSIGH